MRASQRCTIFVVAKQDHGLALLSERSEAQPKAAVAQEPANGAIDNLPRGKHLEALAVSRRLLVPNARLLWGSEAYATNSGLAWVASARSGLNQGDPAE